MAKEKCRECKTSERKTRVPSEYLMTTFWGGSKHGRCLQISGTTHTATHPTTKERIATGQYTQLTSDQAKEMIKDLQDFIDNKLIETP